MEYCTVSAELNDVYDTISWDQNLSPVDLLRNFSKLKTYMWASSKEIYFRNPFYSQILAIFKRTNPLLQNRRGWPDRKLFLKKQSFISAASNYPSNVISQLLGQLLKGDISLSQGHQQVCLAFLELETWFFAVIKISKDLLWI